MDVDPLWLESSHALQPLQRVLGWDLWEGDSRATAARCVQEEPQAAHARAPSNFVFARALAAG